MIKEKESIETIIVHGDHSLCKATGAISPPIYASSTFAFKDADQGADLFANPDHGYFYTRMSNPTVDILKKKIAILEKAQHGIAFGSGMAAIHAVIAALTTKESNIVGCETIYGGTFKILKTLMPKFGVETRWINFLDLEKIDQMIDKKTSLVFFESPANPTTTVYDIKKIVDIAHSKGVPVVIDNTFMSPYLQNPISLGVDVVIHSATKYLCGHADVVAGLVACNDQYYEKIMPILIQVGGIISPFDAWLLLRGIKTLHVRMDRHCQNALKVAQYLEGHKSVKKVLYPGLKNHPQYDLAQKQMKGAGGIISIEVNGGVEASKVVMNNLHIFTLAVSLGDIDSLIQHPYTMTHSSYTKDELERAGVTDSTLRLSIGLEDPDDLIQDLDNALRKIQL